MRLKMKTLFLEILLSVAWAGNCAPLARIPIVNEKRSEGKGNGGVMKTFITILMLLFVGSWSYGFDLMDLADEGAMPKGVVKIIQQIPDSDERAFAVSFAELRDACLVPEYRYRSGFNLDQAMADIAETTNVSALKFVMLHATTAPYELVSVAAANPVLGATSVRELLSIAMFRNIATSYIWMGASRNPAMDEATAWRIYGEYKNLNGDGFPVLNYDFWSHTKFRQLLAAGAKDTSNTDTLSAIAVNPACDDSVLELIAAKDSIVVLDSPLCPASLVRSAYDATAREIGKVGYGYAIGRIIAHPNVPRDVLEKIVSSEDVPKELQQRARELL